MFHIVINLFMFVSLIIKSMKKIYKYELSVKEKQSVGLPVGAKIIRVGDIDGKFYLWAIVDPEIKETQFRSLEFYKTGQPIEDDSNLTYLGLCTLFIMQELGLYVFERLSPIQPYTT